MSNAFSRKFTSFVGGVVDSLEVREETEDLPNKVYKSALSPAGMSPGDVLFFS